MEYQKTSTTPDRIHMVRIRPEANERRFYTLEAGYDFFGPVLVRRWGRIGQSCHQRLDPFPSADDTVKAMTSISSRKRRRGYQDAAW